LKSTIAPPVGGHYRRATATLAGRRDCGFRSPTTYTSSMADRPNAKLQTVNIDCDDADAMAAFYGRLLGWDVTWRDGGFILMRDPEGGVGLSFQADPRYKPPVWPEQPGEQAKMIHLDIKVDDLDAATAFALASGALLAEYQGREDLRVLLDPAGHPFCLFTV
jgi:catechol 2,3-dioxygenase-like lactoylglutathione lyase family enzyme